MSYSGGGGPHIWVPRRLSGLGDSSGRYILEQTLGVSDIPSPGELTSGAQGYITSQMASRARSAFRQNTGIDMPWVPTSTSQVGPWAKEQAKAWATPEIKAGIDQGRRILEDKLSGNGNKVYADIRSPLDESEVGGWALAYISAHGPPTSSSAAVAMMQSFVMTNADAIGLPPEFIAASGLIQNFPTTTEGAEQWGLTLGTAYLAQFGVPIITSTDPSAFLSSCGRAAIAQTAPGVPFSLCEATYRSLSDGSINFAEAQGLVIGACAWIGALVGQAFGLPAPLGALLSQLIASEIVPILADALGFGPSDSEKLNQAQDAARKAAAAATIVCTDLARALWLQYQHYWDSMSGNLDRTIRANQEWLLTGGACSRTDGIRVFPETTPGANTLDIVCDKTGAPILVNGKPIHYAHPISRWCTDPNGCPYLAYSIDSVVRRSSYSLSTADLKRVPNSYDISAGSPGCDAVSALACWEARRYVTPNQVLYEMQGKKGGAYLLANTTVQSQLDSRNAPSWDSYLHSDEEYLAQIGLVQVTGGAGQSVGECGTPEWGRYLYNSLQQAAAASALVQRDLSRTVSSASTQYGMKKHMEAAAGADWSIATAAQKREAVRKATANAATFRTAILEAKRRGGRTRDTLNYSLLAAGSAALLGWMTARRR